MGLRGNRFQAIPKSKLLSLLDFFPNLDPSLFKIFPGRFRIRVFISRAAFLVKVMARILARSFLPTAADRRNWAKRREGAGFAGAGRSFQ